MLMALLYCDHDRIAAAALACDQTPYGAEYWSEIHPAEIDPSSILETAYVTINDRKLRQRLLSIGVDESADGTALASEIERAISPDYFSEAA